MFDMEKATNIAKSIQIKSQNIEMKGPKLAIFAVEAPLSTPVEIWKIPMGTFELKNQHGRAPAPLQSTEPVYADVTVETENPSEGCTVTRVDWGTYKFDQKLNSFAKSMAGLQDYFANKSIAKLLAQGATKKCTYDGQTFFSPVGSKTHTSVPGYDLKFCNTVDGLLRSTTIASMTAKIVVQALIVGFQNLRSRAMGSGGGIMDFITPKYIVCHSRMQGFVEMAVNGKFFENNDNVIGRIWDVEVVYSPYIDQQMEAAGLAGDQLNQIYILGESNDEAGAFIKGTFLPFEFQTLLGQIQATGKVDAFTMQYQGTVGYAYGLPQYATLVQ